jgi:hypothetical protein
VTALTDKLIAAAFDETDSGIGNVPGFALAIRDVDSTEITLALIELARLVAMLSNQNPRQLVENVLEGWREAEADAAP